MPTQNRRDFLHASASVGFLAATASVLPFNILKSQPRLAEEVIGHNDFRYRVQRDWAGINQQKLPVNNCHEMVMSRDKKLFMLTDRAENNVLIFDKSGKITGNWTLNFKGAHGLSIHDEGGTEYLYLTDVASGTVVKTTLAGQVVLTLPDPRQMGAYNSCDSYRPTETTIGPNGDIYVADGYGAQFILRFDAQGNFISKFGGASILQPAKFQQAHGVALDTRDPTNPRLICSARIKNTFKVFSLEGDHLEDIYLPGAFISRPVIDGDYLYSGVCFGMKPENYGMFENRGFVTILDRNHKVVSNPGGTKPRYKKGKLKMMLQEQPIFRHCHDVCVDDDKNLYVCQWKAGQVYPYKLIRV